MTTRNENLIYRDIRYYLRHFKGQISQKILIFNYTATA